MNEEILLTADPVFTWTEIYFLTLSIALVALLAVVLTDKAREYRRKWREKWHG